MILSRNVNGGVGDDANVRGEFIDFTGHYLSNNLHNSKEVR